MLKINALVILLKTEISVACNLGGNMSNVLKLKWRLYQCPYIYDLGLNYPGKI